MADVLGFLVLLSIFGGIVGFFLAIQDSLFVAFITLFSGISSGIFWYVISQILNYLKSMNESIITNNELIQKLNKQLRDDTKVLNTEENWECSHCGVINPPSESRCKECGFY